jgi:hypothetical protein
MKTLEIPTAATAKGTGSRCLACDAETGLRMAPGSRSQFEGLFVSGEPVGCTICGHAMSLESTGLRNLTRDEAERMAIHPAFAEFLKRRESFVGHLIG